MDYDIHYYGTYAAARIAGWGASDAQVIADAALFVDYCDYNKFGYTYVLENRVLGVPVITSQFLSKFSYKDANDPSIWVPFHFLPGNFEGENYGKEYVKRDVDSSVKLGAYLCRPYSPLVKSMIADTQSLYNDLKKDHKTTALYLVGLRMHIFADTWAHQDFCGFNDETTNNCGPNVHQYNDKKKALSINATKKEYDLQAAPPGSNMGHGRMGHLPDMGWLQYDYEPQWAKKGKLWQPLFRNNQVEFKETFEQMIKALYFIRTNTTIEVAVKDSSRMSLQEEKDLILNQSSRSKIEYPSSFIDIINKKRSFGSSANSVFAQAANDWCSKLLELKLLQSDVLRNMDSKTHKYNESWESSFINRYLDDFEVLGSANLSEPWKRKAKLKPKSNFLSFQEAAALHMNFFTEQLTTIKALNVCLERITDAWSYSNSCGFRCYVKDKFK